MVEIKLFTEFEEVELELRSMGGLGGWVQCTVPFRSTFSFNAAYVFLHENQMEILFWDEG